MGVAELAGGKREALQDVGPHKDAGGRGRLRQGLEGSRRGKPRPCPRTV
jgi:hypothetical protein